MNKQIDRGWRDDFSVKNLAALAQEPDLFTNIHIVTHDFLIPPVLPLRNSQVSSRSPRLIALKTHLIL